MTVKESRSKNLLGTNFLEETELDDSTKDSDVPLFDLHTIAVATANFSVDNKLGQGGFGSVYKVIFLEHKSALRTFLLFLMPCSFVFLSLLKVVGN